MTDDPGLFATLYSSRAIRRFTSDPVPEEVAFQLIDAAIRAPTGHNRQDWRFVLVTDDEAKQRMQEWSVQTWDAVFGVTYPTLESIDALGRTARLSIRSVHDFAATPLVVVVTGLRGAHANSGGSHYPAVQNLLLAARALGLAGSIFNPPMARPDELAALLQIPDNNVVYAVVAVGYPADKPGPVSRKPVHKVAYLGRFGRPWPFAADQPASGWADRWA